MIISPRLSHTFFPLLSDNDFRWKGMNKNQEFKTDFMTAAQFHNWSDLMLQWAFYICCLNFFYLIHIESIVWCLLLRRTIATGLVVGAVRIMNEYLNADMLMPILLQIPHCGKNYSSQKVVKSDPFVIFLTSCCRNSWHTYFVLWLNEGGVNAILSEWS